MIFLVVPSHYTPQNLETIACSSGLPQEAQMGPIASGTGLFSACPRGAQPRHEVGQFLLLLAELTFNPVRFAESFLLYLLTLTHPGP